MTPYQMTVSADTLGELASKLYDAAATMSGSTATMVMAAKGGPHMTIPPEGSTYDTETGGYTDGEARDVTEEWFGSSVEQDRIADNLRGTATETDSANFPWDERIHSSNHKTVKSTGLWARRRNVLDATFDAVCTELKALMGNDTPTVAVGGDLLGDWMGFIGGAVKVKPVLISWVQLARPTSLVDGVLTIVFEHDKEFQYNEVSRVSGDIEPLLSVFAGTAIELEVVLEELPKKEWVVTNFQELMNYITEEGVNAQLLDAALLAEGLTSAAELLTDPTKVPGVFEALKGLAA